MESVGVLLVLGSGGDNLSVDVVPHPVPGQLERWFDVSINAEAHPFSGMVTQILTEADLRSFQDQLRSMTVPGEVSLGGGRALELGIVAEQQDGGGPGLLVLEVNLTPSGDDPYPALRWLLFDQTPFWADAVSAIDRVLRVEE